MIKTTPDALILPPEARRNFGRTADNVAWVARIAEPLIGVNRRMKERAYIRKQEHGRMFISKDPYDTLQFPRNHERSGQARYVWVKQVDGSELGYLVDGAEPRERDQPPPTPPPPPPTWRQFLGQS